MSPVYSSNKPFSQKVALVTGAASGIGRATAIAFARQGATVVLADHDREKGAQVANEIETFGGLATFIPCDVSKPEEVRHLIEQTVMRFHKLDFAFNNAGIEGEQARTAECHEANWDRVIGINLKGVWLCMKSELPIMARQGGGVIVNCSSVAGMVGFQGFPAYVASKHGVIGLTKTAALEYAHEKVRINAISPGVIQTPMIDRIVLNNEQIRESLYAGEPIGRAGRPEEIAETVLWLCAENSAFVTGATIAVDGGWTAQ